MSVLRKKNVYFSKWYVVWWIYVLSDAGVTSVCWSSELGTLYGVQRSESLSTLHDNGGALGTKSTSIDQLCDQSLIDRVRASHLPRMRMQKYSFWKSSLPHSLTINLESRHVNSFSAKLPFNKLL